MRASKVMSCEGDTQKRPVCSACDSIKWLEVGQGTDGTVTDKKESPFPCLLDNLCSFLHLYSQGFLYFSKTPCHDPNFWRRALIKVKKAIPGAVRKFWGILAPGLRVHKVILVMQDLETLGPHKIGKQSNPPKRSNIYIITNPKIGFSVFSVQFCPIVLVGPFSYSLGGPKFFELVFSKCDVPFSNGISRLELCENQFSKRFFEQPASRFSKEAGLPNLEKLVLSSAEEKCVCLIWLLQDCPHFESLFGLCQGACEEPLRCLVAQAVRSRHRAIPYCVEQSHHDIHVSHPCRAISPEKPYRALLLCTKGGYRRSSCPAKGIALYPCIARFSVKKQKTSKGSRTLKTLK